jgi:hypothetical protein
MGHTHTDGKGKRVGRRHLSVRMPRWVAVEPEAELGAHRRPPVGRAAHRSSVRLGRVRGWPRGMFRWGESNRRSFAGVRLTRSAKLHRTATPATAAGLPTGWALGAARATGSGVSYAEKSNDLSGAVQAEQIVIRTCDAKVVSPIRCKGVSNNQT